MTSQRAKQTIAIRILSNISRIKNNQTKKFGQLIECETAFLKNHTQNVVGKLFPDLCQKIDFEHISSSVV